MFFFACGGVERRGHPFRGGWSHSPPVGKGGDVDDDVLCCGWVGCGGVERRGHPFRGGRSHSPPVGKGGDEDDDVTFLSGGGFCFKF